MEFNEKRFVKVIAEQMARILELEDMLDEANQAFKKLSVGVSFDRVKK